MIVIAISGSLVSRRRGSRRPGCLRLTLTTLSPANLSRNSRSCSPISDTAGYRANFIYCINGKKLHSGIYPPVTVLYRREAASYFQDGHTQRVVLEGTIEELRSPMLHDDRKSLRRWFNSQARYTELEAQKLRAANWRELGLADRMRRWRFVVPPAMLVYCLIVRGGIFDGWPGFYYAFQRTLQS